MLPQRFPRLFVARPLSTSYSPADGYTTAPLAIKGLATSSTSRLARLDSHRPGLRNGRSVRARWSRDRRRPHSGLAEGSESLPALHGTKEFDMNLRARATLCGVCLAAASAVACSGSHDQQSAGAHSENTGTVGLSLAIAPGLSISKVNWTIHNPSLLAADMTGTADVSQSQTIQFVVGGLPVGGAYTVALSATTSSGLSCGGSAAFSISASATSNVTVNVVCAATSVDAGSNGSVNIGGTVTVANECAAVSSLSASPSSVNVGGVIGLLAQGADSTGNSSDVTFSWAATGGTGSGTLSGTATANPTFICMTAGPVTVTVTASISDGGADCTNNTASVALTCTASASLGDASMPPPAPPHPPPGGGTDSGGLSPGSIFVIDSTNSLFSLDPSGNLLGSVGLPVPIGNINGGGIGLASNDLYVTIGQFTNEVVSFDLTLVSHPAGAFAGLSVPRGIAYDPNNQQFYIGNGASTVNVYNATGSSVATSGSFPGYYGPSGVAYDPDDNAIWVANYVGSPAATPPLYGVSEYTPSGALYGPPFNYATQFITPTQHVEPYSITVCPAAVTNGMGTVVVVGFIDDGSGLGNAVVQAYSATTGRTLAPPFGGTIKKPYALSCDSAGNVYIADVTGLYYENTLGQNLGLPGGFAGLTPPIYGVLAAPVSSVSAFATEYCGRLNTCNPGLITALFGTVSGCVAQMSSTAVPSLVNSASCTAFVNSASCSDLVRGDNATYPQACGPLAFANLGDNCASDSQCTTSFCQRSASEPSVGTCANPTGVVQVGTGNACTSQDQCAWGEQCEPSSASGAPTGDAAATVCLPLATLGQPCSTSAFCDSALLLYCDGTTSTCLSIPVAGSGAACGANDAVCEPPNVCVESSTGAFTCAAQMASSDAGTEAGPNEGGTNTTADGGTTDSGSPAMPMILPKPQLQIGGTGCSGQGPFQPLDLCIAGADAKDVACSTVCAVLFEAPIAAAICLGKCAYNAWKNLDNCHEKYDCASGQCCGGTCVDTTSDPNNCGACSESCPTNGRCIVGTCECLENNQIICGAQCVDPQSDPNNCGGCGVPCNLAQSCVNGTCLCTDPTICPCADGMTNCNGTCTDTSSDAANCGGCGTACPTGQVCTDGMCGSCPSGQTDCGGSCTDTQTDPANCDGCGRVCAGPCCDGLCLEVGAVCCGMSAEQGLVACGSGYSCCTNSAGLLYCAAQCSP
jgi:hypothetical protein